MAAICSSKLLPQGKAVRNQAARVASHGTTGKWLEHMGPINAVDVDECPAGGIVVAEGREPASNLLRRAAVLGVAGLFAAPSLPVTAMPFVSSKPPSRFPSGSQLKVSTRNSQIDTAAGLHRRGYAGRTLTITDRPPAVTAFVDVEGFNATTNMFGDDLH